MKSGFIAKPIGRYGIKCPACGGYVRQSAPPKLGESVDKSLYICKCGWESKNERMPE